MTLGHTHRCFPACSQAVSSDSLERSHISCKHPSASLNAMDKITTEMLSNREEFFQCYLGPAQQLLSSLAQDVQQNRNVCVCLWELPEGRTGAK